MYVVWVQIHTYAYIHVYIQHVGVCFCAGVKLT